MLNAFLNKEIISDLVFDSHGEEEFYHCQWPIIWGFF